MIKKIYNELEIKFREEKGLIIKDKCNNSSWKLFNDEVLKTGEFSEVDYNYHLKYCCISNLVLEKNIEKNFEFKKSIKLFKSTRFLYYFICGIEEVIVKDSSNYSEFFPRIILKDNEIYHLQGIDNIFRKHFPLYKYLPYPVLISQNPFIDNSNTLFMDIFCDQNIENWKRIGSKHFHYKDWD